MKRLMFLLALAGAFLVAGSAFATLCVDNKTHELCKKQKKVLKDQRDTCYMKKGECNTQKNLCGTKLSTCKVDLGNCKTSSSALVASKSKVARYQWEARALLYFYCKTYQKDLPVKVKKGKPDMRKFCQAFLKKKGVSTIPAVYKSAYMKELKWFFGFVSKQHCMSPGAHSRMMKQLAKIMQELLKLARRLSNYQLKLSNCKTTLFDTDTEYKELKTDVLAARYLVCLWHKKRVTHHHAPPWCKKVLKKGRPKDVILSLNVRSLYMYGRFMGKFFQRSETAKRKCEKDLAASGQFLKRYRKAALEARKSAFNLIYNTCHYGSVYLAAPQRVYCAKTLPGARKTGWDPKKQLSMVPLRWVNKRIQGLSGKLGDLCSLLKKKKIKHPHCK